MYGIITSFSIKLFIPNKGKILDAIEHACCWTIIIIYKLYLLSLFQIISLEEIVVLLSFQKLFRWLQLLVFQEFPIKFLKEVMIFDIIDILHS